MNGPRIVLAAGLVVLARLVDVALLARLPLPGASIDLTLLVVVALALLGGSRAGATVGLAAGLLADLTPPAATVLGVTALAYGLGGMLAGRWHRPGDRSVLLPVVAAAVAAFGSTLVRVLAAAVRGGVDPGRAVELLATSAAYSALAALLVVPLVVALDRRVEADAFEAVR